MSKKYEIDVTERDPGDVLSELETVMYECEDADPVHFHRCASLVRVQLDAGRPSLEPVSIPSLDALVHERCLFKKKSRSGSVPTRILEREVKQLMARVREWTHELTQVIETPVFWRAHRDAPPRIIWHPGYDRKSRFYVAPSFELFDLRIDKSPPEAEVRSAVAALQGFLTDFPFVDEASRANYFAFLITAFVRPMIDGPVPLVVIDSRTRHREVPPRRFVFDRGERRGGCDHEPSQLRRRDPKGHYRTCYRWSPCGHI